jgi:hypothetical protein
MLLLRTNDRTETYRISAMFSWIAAESKGYYDSNTWCRLDMVQGRMISWRKNMLGTILEEKNVSARILPRERLFGDGVANEVLREHI